jgi:hypothetical protein
MFSSAQQIPEKNKLSENIDAHPRSSARVPYTPFTFFQKRSEGKGKSSNVVLHWSDDMLFVISIIFFFRFGEKLLLQYMT